MSSYAWEQHKLLWTCPSPYTFCTFKVDETQVKWRPTYRSILAAASTLIKLFEKMLKIKKKLKIFLKKRIYEGKLSFFFNILFSTWFFFFENENNLIDMCWRHHVQYMSNLRVMLGKAYSHGLPLIFKPMYALGLTPSWRHLWPSN